MAKSAKTGKKQKKAETNGTPTLPMPALATERLDIGTLETWLWDAACAIRGATDASKFMDFILPLIFFKRLSDVFDDEFAGQEKEFGNAEVAREVVLLWPRCIASLAYKSCRRDLCRD
jgi:type I restriction enzyme M protein